MTICTSVSNQSTAPDAATPLWWRPEPLGRGTGELFRWASARFMKSPTSIVIVALLASMFAGCSKHSPPAPKVADLGVVEVTNGSTNRVTSEDGRVFVVRSFILKNQKVMADGKETILKGQTIVLMISQEQTDSHGVTHLSQDLGIGATPGQTVGIGDGVVSIRITPKIKI